MALDRVTMWRGQKDWTMSNEAEFNRLSSLEQPYCSVCALLYNPIKGSAKSGTAAVPNSQLPTSSPVLLPEELFTRSPMQAMVGDPPHGDVGTLTEDLIIYRSSRAPLFCVAPAAKSASTPAATASIRLSS